MLDTVKGLFPLLLSTLWACCNQMVRDRIHTALYLEHRKHATSCMLHWAKMQEVSDWAEKVSKIVVVLAVHVDLAAGSNPAAVLRGVTHCCSDAGVQHSTVQLSAQGEPCPCNPESIKHTIAAGLQLH